MWAVIIEEGVRWGGLLLRHTSTAKNKHLLISSPPPPSPNHCLLPVYRLTEISGNGGSGNNGSYSLQTIALIVVASSSQRKIKWPLI